jgi:GNAT superfamily N-acetyltransferase
MNITLIPQEQLDTIIPLLNVLNDQISHETLKQRLSEMISQGYQCIGAYDEDKLVGICGIWIMTKYYVGKHIEPDNVLVLPEYRGTGLGKALLAWVYEYGRSQGCIASELNCYLPNTAGQQFWEAEGYTAIGYHYQKQL